MPTIHTTTIIPYDISKVMYCFRGNMNAKNRSKAIAVKVNTEVATQRDWVNGMNLHNISENIPFDQSKWPVTSSLMVTGTLKPELLPRPCRFTMRWFVTVRICLFIITTHMTNTLPIREPNMMMRYAIVLKTCSVGESGSYGPCGDEELEFSFVALLLDDCHHCRLKWMKFLLRMGLLLWRKLFSC